MCVCVCEHISGTAGPIFTKFVARISCGRGSILLWRRRDTLCTSGFMDDDTFGRSRRYGDAWLEALRYGAESDVYDRMPCLSHAIVRCSFVCI